MISLKACWVAFLRLDSAISVRPGGFAGHRSPTFSGRGSSSLELFVLFSVLLQPPAFHACRAFHLSVVTRFARKRLPRDFCPLRDFSRSSSDVGSHSPARVLPRVAPVRTRPFGRSVLGVLHALDGLLRSLPCESISPRCHVQGSALQGFSPRQSGAVSSTVPPLLSVPALQLLDGCPTSSTTAQAAFRGTALSGFVASSSGS